MKVIAPPAQVKCSTCGAVIGEITKADVMDMGFVEDVGLFLPRYSLEIYKGIFCPCCGSKIKLPNQ